MHVYHGIHWVDTWQKATYCVFTTSGRSIYALVPFDVRPLYHKEYCNYFTHGLHYCSNYSRISTLISSVIDVDAVLHSAWSSVASFTNIDQLRRG